MRISPSIIATPALAQRARGSRVQMRRFVFIFVALLGTGCATITRGTREALVVESDPPGADVQLSNGLRGRTPTSFSLERDQNLVVTISKPG